MSVTTQHADHQLATVILPSPPAPLLDQLLQLVQRVRLALLALSLISLCRGGRLNTRRRNDAVLSALLLIFVSSAAAESFFPFVQRGHVHRVGAVIGAQFHINQTRLTENCEQARDNFASANAFAKMDFTHRKILLRDEHSARLKQLNHLCDSTRIRKNSHVSKRSPLLFAALGFLLHAYGSSIFPSTSHDLATVQHNLHTLDQEMENLQTYTYHFAREMEHAISGIHHSIDFNRFHITLLDMERSIDNSVQGLSFLLQGQLTTDIMDFEQVNSLFEQLRQKADELNLKLPFTDPLMLYTLPVRLVSHENGFFEFSLAVPLVSSSLELWQSAHAPVLVHANVGESNQKNAHFLSPLTEYDSVIHSDLTTSTSPISPGELAQCALWQGDYFCTHLVSTQDDRSCIATMFHSPEKALDVCNFHFASFPVYHLSHLSPNDILLSLNVSTLHYDIICDNATTSGVFKFGQAHIHLPDGCRLSTQLFSIPALTTVKINFKLQGFTFDSCPYEPTELDSFKSDNPSRSLLDHIALEKFNNSSGVLSAHIVSIIFFGIIVTAICVLKYVHLKRTK